jgi:hypothetical protein
MCSFKSVWFPFFRNHISASVVGMLLSLSGLYGQSLGDYRTNGAVNFSTATNWQRYNGSTWVAASAAPNFNDGLILIRNGHTADINVAVTLDQVVIESGGVLARSTASTDLTINDGVGHDIVIQNGGLFLHSSSNVAPLGTGTIEIQGGGMIRITNNTGGQAYRYANNQDITFAARMFWQHEAIFETSVFGAYPTANITYFPNVSAGVFPIFRQGVTLGLVGANTPTTFRGTYEANGNITFNNTGEKRFLGGLRIGAGAEVSQSTTCGLFVVEREIGGPGAIVLQNGNIHLNQVRLTNNIRIDNNSTDPGTALITTQNAVDFSTFVLSGTANFSAQDTLKTANAQGFSATAALGSVQNTGTRNFATVIGFRFYGTTNQVTGSGLPAAIQWLEIDNTQTVTLSQNLDVSGYVQLRNGTFALQNSRLRLLSADNQPLRRTNGRLQTTASSSLQLGNAATAGGAALVLSSDFFTANPAPLQDFTLFRNNGLSLLNLDLRIHGTLTVGRGVLNLQQQIIDLGNDGVLSEDYLNNHVVTDLSTGLNETNKGGYLLFQNRTVGSTIPNNIAGSGVFIARSNTDITLDVRRYHYAALGFSILRVYSIQLTAGTINAGNTATVRIAYPLLALNGHPAADLRVYRNAGGGWQELGRNPSQTSLANQWVGLENIQSFSDWTLAPENSPLPIDLLRWEVDIHPQNPQHARLRWTVRPLQTDTISYWIDKSTNLQIDNTHPIVHLRVSQNLRNSPVQYQAIDTAFQQSAYYRLRWYDQGRLRHSEWRYLAKNNTNAQDWVLYPNPTPYTLSLKGGPSPDEYCTILLLDIQGRQLWQQSGAFELVWQQLNEQLIRLSSGPYLLKIETRFQQWNSRFQKE